MAIAQQQFGSALSVGAPQLVLYLINLAEGEGVSLNQYIVYALTRQVTLSYAVRTVSFIRN
ncbi:MAG: hypothetical protein AAFY21_19890 [Cyanobacteria bacterium J06641_2]